MAEMGCKLADIGFIRGQLNGIKDENVRNRLITVFEYVLGNFRFGEPDHQTRAENGQLYWMNSTTPATALEEFSFVHGLGSAPRYALVALELDKPGATIVPLQVSRVADSQRLYLKSSSTSAPILLLLE